MIVLFIFGFIALMISMTYSVMSLSEFITERKWVGRQTWEVVLYLVIIAILITLSVYAITDVAIELNVTMSERSHLIC